MDAEDLIARVYPNSDKDRYKYAERAIKASSYYVPPLYQEPQEEVQYGRDDREVTEPPDEPADRKASGFDGMPFIEVKFSMVPRSSHGLLFGCSKKCDIVLPNIKGPSNYHLCLTFDEQNRFVVKDLESGIGTEVNYNDKGKGTRRKFNWIVGGDDNAHRKKKIIIKVHDHIQFQVVAAEHDITSQSYIDNVKKFCQGTATAEGLFDDLNIFRRDTELPTEAHTPGEGCIYVKKKIGKGGFGVAIHCWNVSTGAESVIKRPSMKVIKEIAKHDKTWKRWKEEAENMRKLTHEHILKLLHVTYDPYPELELEYVQGGPLSKLKNVTVPESVLVLTQCLSALAYLHEGQLAHRDISPNNILVRKREPFQVVLADFGLSKNAAELRTQCGTTPYAAPEIFEDRSIVYYSAAVDIWSLGVVTCEILRILPSYSEYTRHLEQCTTEPSWCSKLVDSLGQLYRRRPDSLKGFLLASMLVISPAGRNSAQGCYDRVKSLPDLIVGSRSSNRISDVLWRESTVVYSSDVDTNKQSTIRLKHAALVADAGDTDDTYGDGESTDGIISVDSSSSDDRARCRSAAPPPSSRRSDARSNLKRPMADMAPQSPGSKRQGRASISQSKGSPGAHLLETEADRETAEVAALLQDLRNGAYRRDNLPSPPLESIPSWHPWDPFDKKPFSWNDSLEGSNPDQTTQGATNANKACTDCASSKSLPNTQKRHDRTRNMTQYSKPALSISRVLNASVLGSPLAKSQQHRSYAMPDQTSPTPSETPGSVIAKAVQSNDEEVNNSSMQPPFKNLPTLAATENSASVASHLSTRAVLTDDQQPNVWFMVIKQHRVSLRLSDSQLHAGQILKAAQNVTEGRRDSFVRNLRGRGLKPQWVPFRDGVFLCQATALSEELQPLFSLSTERQPNPTENYFLNTPGFATFAWEYHTITYRPRKQTVNATSLLRLSNKPKEYLEGFLQDNPLIKTEKRTASLHQALDGLYISTRFTQALCKTLGIDMTVVEMLENACPQTPRPALREGADRHHSQDLSAEWSEGGGKTKDPLSISGVLDSNLWNSTVADIGEYPTSPILQLAAYDQCGTVERGEPNARLIEDRELLLENAYLLPSFRSIQPAPSASNPNFNSAGPETPHVPPREDADSPNADLPNKTGLNEESKAQSQPSRSHLEPQFEISLSNANYRTLCYDGQTIFFRTDGFVNFTQLGRWAKIRPHEYYSSCDDKQMVRGRSPRQGAYIEIGAARTLLLPVMECCGPIDKIEEYLRAHKPRQSGGSDSDPNILLDHGTKDSSLSAADLDDDFSAKCQIRSHTKGDYLVLSCDGKDIFFSSDGYINFNHLAKWGNCPGSGRNMMKGHKERRVVRGTAPEAGTYIGRYAAKVLCKHCAIDCKPVDHIGAFLTKNFQSTHHINESLTTKVNHIDISITNGCEWNLSAMLKASTLLGGEQDSLLEEIEQAVRLRKEREIYWIPCLEGLQVIRYTGLETSLQNVISTVLPFRVADEEYLLIGKHRIYFTLRGEIHLYSIAEWGGLSRKTARGYCQGPKKNKDVRVYQGGNGIQGSFVPLVDAKDFCCHYGLGQQPVDEVQKCLRARLIQSLKTGF